MARNKSRLNKLLNFIGLVDESDDRDYDYDDGRPQGSSTYNPQSRRSGSNYDAPRQQRGRDDYDSRYSQPPRGSNYYEERDRYAASSRYQQEPTRDYRSSSSSSRDSYSQPRSAAPQSRRTPDYERPASRDYARDSYQSSSRPQPSRQTAQQPRYDEFPPQRQPASRKDDAPPQQQNNVVPLREAPRTSGSAVIFYLHQLDECREVIMALLDNKSVFLNLEDMDERLVQRGIDTLSGAAFALQAKLERTSEKTILIAPSSVRVEMSAQEERY